MNRTPRTLTVPGIPEPIREQTLEEYVALLSTDHYAREQFTELQKMSLEGARYREQALNLLGEVTDLKAQLETLNHQTGLLVDEVNEIPNLTQVPELETPNPLPEALLEKPKAPCPTCGKPISILPGPWAAHMSKEHNLTKVPRPV